MSKQQFGVIDLGVMGLNLGLNAAFQSPDRN